MQKRHKGGEDAAVLTDRVLSVADGVGGWAESNVDPAIYFSTRSSVYFISKRISHLITLHYL